MRICAGRKAALGVTVVGVKSRKERLCNVVRRVGAERRRFARKAEGIASEALILFLLGAGGSAKAETSRVMRSISHFRLCVSNASFSDLNSLGDGRMSNADSMRDCVSE